MSRAILYLILGCLFVSACQPSGPPSVTEDRASAIADTVQTVFDEWNEQWTALNVDGLMQYFADEDDVVWAVDGSITSGREAIETWMREAVEPIEVWHSLEFGDAHIEVLGPNAAVHTAYFEESFTVSGGDTLAVRGAWTNVFKRINGEWKIIHSAASHASESEQE